MLRVILIITTPRRSAALPRRSSGGFTLIEVIAGMLIATLTFSVTANLVVMANLYKVASKKNAVMKSLVQSDLEVVRAQANALPSNNALCSGTTSAGYASALRNAVASSASSTNPNANLASAVVVNEQYRVNRTFNTITDPNILPITYQVTNTRGKSQNFSLYIEVIPNAVFQCPSL